MVHTTADTVHFYYDLEKAGYQGFDRRHFPSKHRLTLTETIYRPRGRRHVPSPPLEEENWRPHGQHIEPRYTNIGPDWSSKIRSIRSPRNPDAKTTLPVGLIEENLHFVRAFPQNWQRTTTDWNYFPDEKVEHRSYKRNFFSDVHLRSLEDLGDGDVHIEQIGHKRKVFDPRNGIPKRTDGDKTYRTAESSTDFHKIGSTLPAVVFGREKKFYGPAKQIVPMKNEKISIVDEKTFEKRQQQNENKIVVDEVFQLENWKPAENLTSAFKVLDRESTEKFKYRPRYR